MLYWSTRRMANFDARSTFNRMISHYLTLIATDELKILSFGGDSLWGTDGINRNNAQPDFIPSCENLIGNNLIEQ